MHHWTSLSEIKELGSAGWEVNPKFDTRFFTTVMATSFPTAEGSFPKTLQFSSDPFWIWEVREAHSLYMVSNGTSSKVPTIYQLNIRVVSGRVQMVI